MLTFVASIFVFGILIFFHELGHFAVAKFVGIKVHEFSLGFGPKLLTLPKGDTSYNLRILPLGGFVRMAGMDPNEKDEEDDGRGFNSKTVGQRIAVIFAGPLMNFLLAVLLFSTIFIFQGIPVATTVISEVIPDFPAAKSGIMAGDRILAVDGQPVDSWEELSGTISQKPEQEIEVTVLRDGVEKSFRVFTARDENNTGKLGIYPEQGLSKGNLFQALALGADYTARITWMILDFVAKMILGQTPADVGGPVRVVSEIGKAAQVGFFFLLQLSAFLSINLGLFNLFPIPALDGSRILFLFWEKVRGRPVDPVKENFIHLIGFGLLLLLIVVITYNDILQVFLSERIPSQR
ncbi:MAG TPA: RIP metalloprotease RseP [Peptococcaceae bacterium]|jgi:regulator of sigma E protease|nr:RIP metalloprotease RseP [Peptococcaceae bacterium]